MPDSCDIDAAIVTLLQNDATLKGLLPDGVYVDEAPPGSKRFALVSVLEAHDEAIFAQRGYESITYLVQAVGLTTVITGPQIKSAAARIDALLEDAQLTVAGYTWMAVYRVERIRDLEVDDLDASIRWYHRGGQYLAEASI